MANTPGAPKNSAVNYRRAVAVVLDTALPYPCDAFYVGTGGNVTVRFGGDTNSTGSDVTLTGLTAGRVYHRLSVSMFRASGATAGLIIALFK